jgi:hypothetical protein
MKPTMYCLTLGLLAAVVMTVPAYPAVETAGAVERSVSPRSTEAEGLVKLALYKQAHWCEYIGDCPFDDDDD